MRRTTAYLLALYLAASLLALSLSCHADAQWGPPPGTACWPADVPPPCSPVPLPVKPKGGTQPATKAPPRTKETWERSEFVPAAAPPVTPPAPLKMPRADGRGCGCDGCPDCQCRRGQFCGKPGCLCVAAKVDQKSAAPPPPVQNFGVDMGKLKGAQGGGEAVSSPPRYTLDGRAVTRAEALDAVGQPTSKDIPDEAGKPYLVVIGETGPRQAVLSDLERSPALAPWKNRLLVRAYAPDAPAVAGQGYVTTGNPSIYLLAPDGAVLARNLDGAYAGPEALAAALAVAAKPYAPDADPDLRPGPSLPSLGVLARLPPWVYAAGGGALVLWAFRNQATQAAKKSEEP